MIRRMVCTARRAHRRVYFADNRDYILVVGMIFIFFAGFIAGFCARGV